MHDKKEHLLEMLSAYNRGDAVCMTGSVLWQDSVYGTCDRLNF